MFIHKNILISSLSWSNSLETNPWYRLLCFSGSHGFTQHFLFLVFETSAMFPIMFYKLRTCSDNAKSTECLLVTSHTLHFPLLASTLIATSLEFLFLNLYLGVLFYKKRKEKKKIFIENHKKIWEILILTDRCTIKKM